MNIHWLDWTLMVVMLAGILGLTAFAQRFCRSVPDFLAANRLAGRYLLTVSGGFAGVISLVGLWEMIYTTGLPPQWWGQINAPVGLFLGLTGFIIYRFRQTRALTLAQFFEERYSRSFRYFAGALCWFSGILNFGIFPAVTANVLICFLGLPESFQLYGWTFPTFPVMMAVYLSLAAYVACSGGQITIMVTDFVQGALLMLIFVAILAFLMLKFRWNEVMAGLTVGVPAGESLVNPFKGCTTEEFSIWYFLIAMFGAIYNAKSWQGNSGYNAAAKTPHEAQLAGVIGTWRTLATNMCLLLIPLIAYAVLHLPAYADIAAPITADIDKLADPQLRLQMTVPLFLRHILPIGLWGLFAAVLLGCAISCDDTYMHAWGTILIQDVIGPLRNRPFQPKTHMLLLRLSIIGVALFAFLFSCFFPLKGYIFMFFALTGAIYLGGAGAVIIGGLYWKRGTTAAAWTALSLGTVLGCGGIVLQTIWPSLIDDPGAKFPINGQWIYFIAMLTASVAYILVSLLGPKHEFNMDRLLHRGKYALTADTVTGDETATKLMRRFSFARLIGISAEFSRWERFLFYGTFGWTMIWWGIFVVGTAINLFWQISDAAWSWYWWFYIWLSAFLGIICTFWIFAGGLRDAGRLFRDLRKKHEDEADDGFVGKRQ
jgi:Na+/solute symporter